jgi:hypothetical protein
MTGGFQLVCGHVPCMFGGSSPWHRVFLSGCVSIACVGVVRSARLARFAAGLLARRQTTAAGGHAAENEAAQRGSGAIGRRGRHSIRIWWSSELDTRCWLVCAGQRLETMESLEPT